MKDKPFHVRWTFGSRSKKFTNSRKPLYVYNSLVRLDEWKPTAIQTPADLKKIEDGLNRIFVLPFE